jgi:hypothetical protein
MFFQVLKTFTRVPLRKRLSAGLSIFFSDQSNADAFSFPGAGGTDPIVTKQRRKPVIQYFGSTLEEKMN